MLVKLKCVGIHVCSFAVSIKGNKVYFISLAITYSVEITSFSMLLYKYKAGCRQTDVVLMSDRSVANLDIMTPFWHRDAGGIEVRGYTCMFICRLYKTDFLTPYLPPWITRLFKKGSTLKGKQKSRLVMIFFFMNWLPLKRVVKMKWLPYKVYPFRLKTRRTIRLSVLDQCAVLTALSSQHFTLVDYGRSYRPTSF